MPVAIPVRIGPRETLCTKRPLVDVRFVSLPPCPADGSQWPGDVREHVISSPVKVILEFLDDCVPQKHFVSRFHARIIFRSHGTRYPLLRDHGATNALKFRSQFQTDGRLTAHSTMTYEFYYTIIFCHSRDPFLKQAVVRFLHSLYLKVALCLNTPRILCHINDVAQAFSKYDYCLNSEYIPLGGWSVSWNDLAETFNFSVT